MKVFISWSGSQSKSVALALRDWLPQVLQLVDPFVSSEDIDKGAKWNAEISQQLDQSDFGVVCVTRENQHAPWLNFEAGALGKSVERGRVACLLVDLPASDVTGPLDAYQHTLPTLEDLTKLVKSINNAAPNPVRDAVIYALVPKLWDELEAALEAARTAGGTSAVESTRSERDMLGELVELTRDLHRQATAVSVDSAAARRVPSAPGTTSGGGSASAGGALVRTPRYDRRQGALLRRAVTLAVEAAEVNAEVGSYTLRENVLPVIAEALPDDLARELVDLAESSGIDIRVRTPAGSSIFSGS